MEVDRGTGDAYSSIRLWRLDQTGQLATVELGCRLPVVVSHTAQLLRGIFRLRQMTWRQHLRASSTSSS